jgi:hypothetical protein
MLPCQKCDVPKMGTKLNMKCQETKQCMDNEHHHQDIKNAQKLIFELGVSVDGVHVKAILSDESYVPI